MRVGAFSICPIIVLLSSTTVVEYEYCSTDYNGTSRSVGLFESYAMANTRYCTRYGGSTVLEYQEQEYVILKYCNTNSTYL